MKHSVIKLEDYEPPPYLIESVKLEFKLEDQETVVAAKIRGYRNPNSAIEGAPLVLNGENQGLLGIELEGRRLEENEYKIEDGILTILDVGDRFEIKIDSVNYPKENMALEGLYISEGMYCTQCEPEGFRRITFFPDRPDIMAVYSTKIIADKKLYPILLSNGNLVGSGDLDRGRHFVEWNDPFPKPSYLFALVAGNLECLEDNFITATGREVSLKIYVEPGEEAKCHYAMECLKRAMKWDEERFGLEYDLDLFMIVAVSHFNMGAMENKGLNIFNSRYVLADYKTATDTDFQRIQSIIAHEYFHNWTGNRVTCRDWFQLSLKEGLTVFRDQEFTADTNSRGIKRITDVSLLRTYQFSEDSSPTAHPVRPSSYIEINNFYTATVYEKGAEVIRLIHSLVGEETFQKGMRLYFARYDGHAVTCEDFLLAMQDASGRDLSQVKLWYTQSGTPELIISMTHDAEKEEVSLIIRQVTPPTIDQATKVSLPIIVETGLLDENGMEYPLKLKGEKGKAGKSRTLEIFQEQHSFIFEKIKDAPIPALLRGFSSPVKLTRQRSKRELLVLMSHERDPFVCWDAGQEYSTNLILEMIKKKQLGGNFEIDRDYIDVIASILLNEDLEEGFCAELIQIPTEKEICEKMELIDVENVHSARSFLFCNIGKRLSPILENIYTCLAEKYNNRDLSPGAMGARSLVNSVLGYLVGSGEQKFINMAFQQATTSETMTYTIGGLQALNNVECIERSKALAKFYDNWRHDPLELDKWFVLAASSTLAGTLEHVIELSNQPSYDILNPNRVRALIGTLSTHNPLHFHNAGGRGYRFLTDVILRLDKYNPQIAARLVTQLTRWKSYDEIRRGLMLTSLKRIKNSKSLSRDVYEIVDKGLKAI